MTGHVKSDTATITNDHVAEGKVGIGVHEKKPGEADHVQHTETQQSETHNPIAQALGVDLQFSVDKETGEHVIKVLDSQNGEVIHQYPPEEFLQLIKNMRDLRGALFSARL